MIRRSRHFFLEIGNIHCLQCSKMLCAVILYVIFVAVESNTCVQRSVGPDAIVCVCNSTYCDTIYKPQLQADQFQLYTSTRDGQRLELTVATFLDEPVEETFLIVNSSQKYQKISGFGGALTDAVVLNIRTLSNATQEKLFESYFGVNGSRYTYIRLPIAGTDFSTRPYTYDDTPGDVMLSNFSLVEEDDYKIDYIKQIKSIMPDPDSLRIFSAAWSAPAWMKTSNEITWGFLKRNYYQTYANYITKFLDAYKERGVDIWGITPGNEPLDGYQPNWTFNAMSWAPQASAFWSVNYLAPTLNESGYKPVYMAMDDQRFELPWYVDQMFKNEEAKQLFDGIALHWYADKFFSPIRLTETHNKYPDKFILMTEACNGDIPEETIGVDLGSWKRGEYYMSDIIENLSYWVSGWIDWNLALNMSGGPNWSDNFVDSPIIVMPGSDEFYKQPMYYAIAHFSYFVPRHSHAISSTGFDNDQNVSAIAFLTPQEEIVVVTFNRNDEPVNVTIQDNDADRKINLQLPAHSFNTLLYLTNPET